MTENDQPGPPAGGPEVLHLPRFELHQKFAMTTNVYRVVAGGLDVAEAKQKRMALKERVTFRDAEGHEAFSFAARQVIDLGATYDVVAADGAPLATFSKDFAKSLARSTFTLEGPGYAATGVERSQGVAILRRVMDIPFLPIHFDFTSADGTILTVERKPTMRDRYAVEVPDPRVDWRVAASVAVALDAMMQR